MQHSSLDAADFEGQKSLDRDIKVDQYTQALNDHRNGVTQPDEQLENPCHEL